MTGERDYTIAEAAALVGVSVAAMRKRVQRGSVPARKNEADEWVVTLDPAAYATASDSPDAHDAVMVAELRDRVAELQTTLQDARDERDRLLTLLEREQGLAALHARRVLELEDSQSTTRPWWRFWGR